MNPLVFTGQVSLLSDLIKGISGCVTEPEVNCPLDFISIILHRSWFYIVALWENLWLVFAVRLQESYMKGVMNMTEVKVAAKVKGIVTTLVVNLCNWERSQPSWF